MNDISHNKWENCPKCGIDMNQLFHVPQIDTSLCKFEAHFNHGLGKEIINKRQIKEELTKINATTGKNIVEIGTDNLQSVKKQKKKYDLDGMSLEDFK